MVEGAETEDFGVPVVKDVTLCLGEFGLGKTFHAGSEMGRGVRSMIL